MKVFNVAEKNDSAKNISEIMARGRYNRRDGLSVYNKIYEFQYQLFDLPVSKECKEANMINIKKTLEKEVRGAQLLIIWTDCDREGENIGMEIVDVCKQVNKRLRVLRARFSEITRPSIERAMANLIQISHTVSDAVDCRMELDLRIGAAFTRFQTMRLQKLFPDSLSNKLVSYGSCQFPTMGFVVERYKEIENFLPEAFWKLKVIHQVDDIRVEFSWMRNRLFDEDVVQDYLEICEENPIARVEKCLSNPKSKYRPLPLDTVELQKLANRKLKMSAKSVMSTAEKLYTQGYISYPRTETNIFPKELNLRPLVEAQVNDQRWGGFARRIIDEYGGPSPRRGKKNDEAHPPIHPTKYSDSLQGDEGRLYEFIVRHFLACVSQDAVGKETTVNIDVNGEKFVAHGLTVIAKNYLEVYTYERWSDKEILNYENVREFEPTAIEKVSGSTEPPKLLTEADLIALMDKNGIGTDATQAEHIETIKNREYVFIENRDKLVPGKLGMALCDGYDSMGIAMSKPNLRADLENDLKLICDGVKSKEEVLADQIAKYRQIFVISMENVNNLDAATQHFMNEAPAVNENELGMNGDVTGLDIPDPVVQCASCSSMIVLKRRQNNSWMVTCQGYPACRQTIWLPATVLQAKVDGNVKCHNCPGNPAMIKMEVKPRSLAPYFLNEFTTCLGGCDQDILQMLDILKLNSGIGGQGAANNHRNNRGGTQNRGTGRGRGGGDSGGGGRDRRGGGGGPPRGGGAVSVTRDGANNTSSQGGSGPMRGTTRGRARGTQPRGGRSQDSGYQSSANTSLGLSAQPPRNQSGPSAGGALTCDCGNPAIILTVRKEGPNQGRDFGKCEASQCNYFQFVDEPPRTVSARPPPAAPSFTRANPGSAFGGGGDDDIINCDCGQPSARRTAMKDGPNKGRDFYCCGKPRDEQCRFFSWADEDQASTSNYNQNSIRQGMGGSSESDVPMCQCYPPLPAIPRTVMKEGNNQTGAHSTGEKKQRTCGLCRQPGHTRNKCPMNS